MASAASRARLATRCGSSRATARTSAAPTPRWILRSLPSGHASCCSTAKWLPSTATRPPSAAFNSAWGSRDRPATRWPPIRSSSVSSTCSRSTARISPASSWLERRGPAGQGFCGQGRRCSSAKPGAATPSEGSRRPAGSGWEGLIAKRADAPLRGAGRSRDWLKLKCAVGAGARRRRLHRSCGQPNGFRRPARRLLRGRPAPVRRQGRDRFSPRRPFATLAPSYAIWRNRRAPIRGRSTNPTRHALDAGQSW